VCGIVGGPANNTSIPSRDATHSALKLDEITGPNSNPRKRDDSKNHRRSDKIMRQHPRKRETTSKNHRRSDKITGPKTPRKKRQQTADPTEEVKRNAAKRKRNKLTIPETLSRETKKKKEKKKKKREEEKKKKKNKERRRRRRRREEEEKKKKKHNKRQNEAEAAWRWNAK
jgi:hypothetical protein